MLSDKGECQHVGDLKNIRSDDGGALSDDEIKSGVKPIVDSNQLLKPAHYAQHKFAQSTKKVCETALNIIDSENKHLKEAAKPGGLAMSKGLDFGSLQTKLMEVNDEEEEAERKKQEFAEKRKQHYKNEFAMAQLLRQK